MIANNVFQFQTRTANPLFDERTSTVCKTVGYITDRASYALGKKFIDKTQAELLKGHVEALAKTNDLESLTENALALDRHIAGSWIQLMLSRETVNAVTAKATMAEVVKCKNVKAIRACLEPIWQANKVAKAKAIVAKAKALEAEQKHDAIVKAIKPTNNVKGKGKNRKSASEMARTSDKGAMSFGVSIPL